MGKSKKLSTEVASVGFEGSMLPLLMKPEESRLDNTQIYVDIQCPVKVLKQ